MDSANVRCGSAEGSAEHMVCDSAELHPCRAVLTFTKTFFFARVLEGPHGKGRAGQGRAGLDLAPGGVDRLETLLAEVHSLFANAVANQHCDRSPSSGLALNTFFVR
jgi:hypothetical protein